MLLAPTQLVSYISSLKSGLWPDGQLKPKTPPRTAQEKLATKESANRKLSALMPGEALLLSTLCSLATDYSLLVRFCRRRREPYRSPQRSSRRTHSLRNLAKQTLAQGKPVIRQMTCSACADIAPGDSILSFLSSTKYSPFSSPKLRNALLPLRLSPTRDRSSYLDLLLVVFAVQS